MASKLSLYNRALMLVGETALASVTEARESRYLLDAVYDGANGLVYCLQQGLWTFATRFSEVNYDPNITPSFGLRYGFSKPEDFVRTVRLCSDPYFKCPFLDYQDQSSYWLADISILYLAYVSKDSNSYGLNLGIWPETFTRWVEHYLALSIAPKVFNSQPKVDALEKATRRALVDARSKDAMELPTSFPAAGSWVRARHGRNTSWDRGNPNRLIG